MKRINLTFFLYLKLFSIISAQDFIADINGNNYEVIQIGNQYWFSENLKATQYCNGDSIPLIKSYTNWSNLSTGAYCFHNNDTSNIEIYGMLYNWYAVTDSRNICPAGWHVPTEDDWNELTEYLGGYLIAGGKMKTDDTIYWNSPNIGASNETNFSALPGGYRGENGGYYPIGKAGQWASSSEDENGKVWSRELFNTSTYLFKGYSGDDGKIDGNSVRCIRNLSNDINKVFRIKENISFYPNPAKTNIFIKNVDECELNISILNLNGQLVKKYLITSKNESVNIEDIKSGVYILKFYSQNKIRTEKILIK